MNNRTHHLCARTSQKDKAFSMLQVLLSLVILACAAILLAHFLLRYFEEARCEAFLKDMKTFSIALRAASKEKSSPAKPNPDFPGLPQGMQNLLKAGFWENPSPLGGKYDWASPPPHRESAEKTESEPKRILGKIGISAFPPSPPIKLNARQVAYLKSKFAAGAVPGVSFRLGFNGWPICEVHQEP